MSPENNHLWNETLAQVREMILPHQYHTWIEHLTFQEQSDRTLILSSPNYFIKEWIDKNYANPLAMAAEKVLGFRPVVEILVEEPPSEPESQTSPQPKQTDALRVEEKKRQSEFEIQLNRNYTFDNFVVGPCNRIGHAAALAVVENPGHAYNPLFLHGSVGLGKTHLMQSICHAMLQRQENAQILYLSCESFVNQFISAIQKGDIETFRYKYRHVDMILIDDIHFLANKERTQDEFFHTFNVLYNAHKQIILSSDAAPKEIPSLEDRLVSRFKWGLVTQMQAPDFETRVAILQRKAKLRNRVLPDKEAQFIASKIDTNMRELEGAVVKVLGYASLANRDVDIPLIQEALSDTLETQQKKITLEHVKDAVVESFGVKLSELQSKRRHKSISHPRQIAMFLARELTDYSLEEVGGYFGGRDHTTVMYAADKIRQNSKIDSTLMATLENLTRQIKKAQG